MGDGAPGQKGAPRAVERIGLHSTSCLSRHDRYCSSSCPTCSDHHSARIASASVGRLSVYAMALVATAFPGSIEEESTPPEAFDTVETEQDRAMMDVSEDAIQQETELDGEDIPNLPIKEAERRAGWRKLPRKYVSHSEGYRGSLAMPLKRFC